MLVFFFFFCRGRYRAILVPYVYEKMGIMVVTDVERSDVEFIARTLALKPCAHIDTFTADRLG